VLFRSRDAVSTYVWWSRAGAQGHAWAGDKARELGRSLDETQHSDAARRLRQVVSELTSGAAAVQSGEVLVVAGQTFRLDGIDAPTLGFHCPLRGTMRDCGLISASALKDLTAGATIECRRLGRFDLHGLPIAHCEVDGYDLSEGMVYTGWARANAQQTVRYVALEAEARAKPRGMWRSE